MPGCLREGKEGDRGTVNEKESRGGDSERCGGDVGIGGGGETDKVWILQSKHCSPK